MQEILFKAKSLNNQWVEGYFIKDVRRAYILTRDKWEQVEIKPQTVCFYTGRNDANGKRIFSNDICQYLSEEYDGSIHTDECSIFWNEELATFDYVGSHGDGIGDTSDLVVVGNIFDKE
ncbi:MAG: YopX family protein [Corallococcus sp.]|nr:YopX family protein [Corallococcus sp.]